MNYSELSLLVVEDDAFQRGLIVNMLRSLGAVSIAEAEDGNQALARVRNANEPLIDLVFCDLHMPEMDGLELLRHLSKEAIQPIVVIGSALDDKLLSSAGCMAKTYGIRLLGTIKKPFTLNQIKELLAQKPQSEKKWQIPESASKFSLGEILQGLRAGQFEPFFQPKVDFRSGRLVGAEALARWVHPELGVIAPYAFIPLLEQQRQIDELTFVMLKKSAEACRALHQQGHVLTISINLSLVSLDDATLADKIIGIVRQTGIDPKYIVLEITESAAMTDAGHALENLTRLCMNGFVLSIDDYGTGYSSMQQLTRIAFGELKIDQSFVKDFAENESLRIVVESSIEMAHKLQVKSVAEGVETQQDWDILKRAGCDTAQGYFIAKPLARADFTSFIENFKPIVNTPSAMAGVQARGNMKILVVDDDNFSRGIVARVLRDLRFEKTRDVDSAGEALKLLETQTFDLIITDVDMPVMSGLAFAHLIRTGKTHAKADTRILVLTGHSNAELLGVALALDVNGFLVKPVIPAVLDEKIRLAMTEKLSLRQPLAYQSVMTDLHELPAKTSVEVSYAPAIVLEGGRASKTNPLSDLSRLPLCDLIPGMIVRESICAKDGTLLICAGKVLSEQSISRLDDLSRLLKDTLFAVERPPK
jgi:EAL domain-containing protein (putative c-di-GMP-specific phosphodiesterase class I)/DNA-binding NarL/FixJ family response regulator